MTVFFFFRFLNTIPTSSADESLLTQLLQLLTVVSSTRSQRDQTTLAWLADLLHDRDGALLRTLSRAEKSEGDASDSALATRRQLNRSLLKFVRATLEFSAFSVHDRLSSIIAFLIASLIILFYFCLFRSKTFECIRGDVTRQLLTRVNRTDAAHFYNLASLESTLACLLHATARLVSCTLTPIWIQFHEIFSLQTWLEQSVRRVRRADVVCQRSAEPPRGGQRVSRRSRWRCDVVHGAWCDAVRGNLSATPAARDARPVSRRSQYPSIIFRVPALQLVFICSLLPGVDVPLAVLASSGRVWFSLAHPALDVSRHRSSRGRSGNSSRPRTNAVCTRGTRRALWAPVGRDLGDRFQCAVGSQRVQSRQATGATWLFLEFRMPTCYMNVVFRIYHVFTVLQAAQLLANLTEPPALADKNQSEALLWGPIVRNEETNVIPRNAVWNLKGLHFLITGIQSLLGVDHGLACVVSSAASQLLLRGSRRHLGQLLSASVRAASIVCFSRGSAAATADENDLHQCRCC